VTSVDVFASCGFHSGKDYVDERPEFKNLSAEKYRQVELLLFRQFTRICSEGCYLKETTEPCAVKFRKVIDDNIADLRLLIKGEIDLEKPDCSYIKNDVVVRVAKVNLPCNTESARACFIDMAACYGEIYCKTPFRALGRSFEKGNYDVVCRAPKGKCLPAFDCFKDETYNSKEEVDKKMNNFEKAFQGKGPGSEVLGL
jgi:hypothetical protein